MVQRIKVDEEILEFPDDMSDADIEAALSKKFENPTPTEAPIAQAQPVPQQQPSMMSELGRQVGLTARAGGQGLADLAGIVTNPMTAAVNKLAGKQVMTPVPEIASQAMTKIGLPEPRNDLEKAVQVGASAMIGTGGQAALATKASNIVPSLAALADDLMRQVIVSGTAGTGSKMSSDYVMELTNSPLAATAAALATGMLVGGATGQAVSKGTNAVSFMKGETKPTLTMAEVKKRAQTAYRKMDEQNAYIRSDSIKNKLFSSFDNTLKDNSFNPSVVSTHKPVADVLNNIKLEISTPFLSFNKLEQMRSALTDLKTSPDSATRRLAGMLVSDFDNYLSSVGYKDVFSTKGNIKTAIDSVKSARLDWRNLSRAETIEDALSAALIRSDKTTASKSELIRNAMINLAANKKAMTPFSKAEQNAIRAVAKGGPVDTALSMLAKFNPERGYAQSTVAGTAATSALLGQGPVSGAGLGYLGAAAAGYGADKYLGVARQGAANKLVNQVASGTVPQTSQNMWWRGMLSAPIEAAQTE